MRSYLLVYFCWYTCLSANFFKPLDFEPLSHGNALSSLLQSMTLLFYEMQNANLSDEKNLSNIIARQVDLIGVIHVFKQQNQYIWPVDLLYFIDLIHSINLKFEELRKNLVLKQIDVISQLFKQIDFLVQGLG